MPVLSSNHDVCVFMVITSGVRREVMIKPCSQMPTTMITGLSELGISDRQAQDVDKPRPVSIAGVHSTDTRTALDNIYTPRAVRGDVATNPNVSACLYAILGFDWHISHA